MTPSTLILTMPKRIPLSGLVFFYILNLLISGFLVCVLHIRVPAWRQLKQSSFSGFLWLTILSHHIHRVLRIFVVWQPKHLHHVVLGNKNSFCWAGHDRPMLSPVHLPTLGKAICSTFGQLYSLKMAKHPHYTVVRMEIEIGSIISNTHCAQVVISLADHRQ